MGKQWLMIRQGEEEGTDEVETQGMEKDSTEEASSLPESG